MSHIEKTFPVDEDFHLKDICENNREGYVDAFDGDKNLVNRHFVKKISAGEFLVVTYSLYTGKHGDSHWHLLGEYTASKIKNHPHCRRDTHGIPEPITYEANIYKEGVTLPDITSDVKVESWIVWCPDSEYPPKKIWDSETHAIKVCRQMSRRHGKRFFACKLVSVSDVRSVLG